MIAVPDFLSWFKDFAHAALVNNERRLVVLSGNEQWALSLLTSIDLVAATLANKAPVSSASLSAQSTLNTQDKTAFQSSIEHEASCLIYSDNPLLPANVPQKRYRDKLGSESDVIIFADSQLTIDAFAALSGTLKAGGIFFLVLPKLPILNEQSLLKEKTEPTRFFKRFYSLIKAMPSHTIITESDLTPLVHSTDFSLSVKATLSSTYPLGCVTKEQYSAVLAIEKVISGHRKRPLVLTADRGRGKSSALAIACAQLMKAHQQQLFTIVITAPDTQALSVFYQQLKQCLPDAEQQQNIIVLGKAQLTFIPVDQLIKTVDKVNLVLVDEAAGIPVYLLEQLLGSYHRMVFSSTVHGYEGAGRGFTLKFQKILTRLCPQWQSLHLHQPIRWRQNDPLEQLVFDACLLNAELPQLSSTLTKVLTKTSSKSITKGLTKTSTAPLLSEGVFKVISADALVANEALLQQVFAILVTAHYQTKPSDLQLLLDNRQVQLAVFFSDSNDNAQLLAVALLMQEGKDAGVNEADIKAIKHGQRRLRNHFLPQSLLSHCGFEQAFNYNYLRIMRIAVHPQMQYLGLGSTLLNNIEHLAIAQGADFIGASFGINPDLLSFWLNSGFATARIGFTKDKASGEHSALLIKSIKTQSKQAQQVLQKNFYRSFDYLLLEEYKTLPTALVSLLLKQNTSEELISLSALDMANVHAFSKGERLYSSCCYSLYLWLKHDLLAHDENISCQVKQDALVLIARLIQKHDSDTICQQFSFTGKKMLNKHIKDYVSKRLKQCELH